MWDVIGGEVGVFVIDGDVVKGDFFREVIFNFEFRYFCEV